MPVIISFAFSILFDIANKIMNLNRAAKCYNRRLLIPPAVGPKTNLQNKVGGNYRQAVTTQAPKQQTVSFKVMSNESILNGFSAKQSVDTLPLNHENYTAYVFTMLFHAHYLPWLKNCYSDSLRVEFSSRLDHFNQSLQSAITDFRYYKRPIGEIAKKHAFALQRKLKITVDEVTRHSDGSKHRIGDKCLRVLIRSTNSASGGGLETTFHYPLRIPLQNKSSDSLDIPTDMNRHNSQLVFEFRLAEDSAESTHFLEVKEYDISGFSGFSTKCTVWDEAVKDIVDVKLSLSWQLSVKSIQEHIKHGHIVASHFSMTLLSLGPYFWRFYSSLFSALLLGAKDTEVECMKCIHEVAFLLDGPQLAMMFKPLIEVIRKHIAIPRQTLTADSIADCNEADCRTIWHIVHWAFLLIEHLTPSEQNDLINFLLQSSKHSAFAHLLRFRCGSVQTWKVLQLQQMGQHQLASVIANVSSRSSKEDKESQTQLQPAQTETFLLFLVQLMIDTVKQEEQLIKVTNSSVEVVAELQSITVRNIAKLLVTFRNNSAQQKENEDSGIEEGIRQAEQMSMSIPFETSVNYEHHQDSENCWLSANDSAKDSQQVKEDANYGMPLKEVLAKLSSESGTSCYNYSLLYSVMPARVVDLLMDEEVLSGKFIAPMMTLLGQVAQEMGISNPV